MATATETTVLEAQPRTAGSKNDARRVRREGKVPGVLYGAGKQALSVSLDPRQISRILRSASGHNTIFELALGGSERTQAMIVDWQYEPIKGALLHIDLKRIAMDQKLHVRVPIVLKGEPEGVKTQGGILEPVTREVEIECLPGDIPTSIEADVSELVFGKVLRVSDLPHEPEVEVSLRCQPAGGAHHLREGRSSADSGSGCRRSCRRPGRARGHQEGQAGDRGRRRRRLPRPKRPRRRQRRKRRSMRRWCGRVGRRSERSSAGW